MSIPRTTVTRIVSLALDEDVGRGDLTTDACIPASAKGRAQFTARERLVFCGVELVREVFAQVDANVKCTTHVADGTLVDKGTALMTIEGHARSLLLGERVALNFVQRLSGVATLTRSYVDAVPKGSSTRIADTRKTTPGLRALERFAVRCGGGHNHREDLSSAVLIKDNHIAAAGGVANAIASARNRAPHTSRIECEVDTMEQLAIALDSKADIILLDNFDDATLGAAVKLVAGRAILEVSGRVTPERIGVIANAGIDVISAGALTHSARAVDIGLDWSEGN